MLNFAAKSRILNKRLLAYSSRRAMQTTNKVEPISVMESQKYTEIHGHVIYDAFASIRHDQMKQKAIIAREKKIFK